MTTTTTSFHLPAHVLAVIDTEIMRDLMIEMCEMNGGRHDARPATDDTHVDHSGDWTLSSADLLSMSDEDMSVFYPSKTIAEEAALVSATCNTVVSRVKNVRR